MIFTFLNSGKVRVQFDQKQRNQCISLSKETHNRYQNVSGYYRNLRSSHLIGRAGEFAVAEFFRQFSTEVESLFENFSEDAKADIVFQEHRIDVKTWNERYWQSWGRCIATKQLHKLEEKATHVVWCTSNAAMESDSWHVTIEGWNRVEEIQNFPKKWTGPPGLQVHNYQAHENDLRPINDLVNLE